MKHDTRDAIARLIIALQNAVDCLEYVDRNHDNVTGYAVRSQRIREANQAVKNAEALLEKKKPS